MNQVSDWRYVAIPDADARRLIVALGVLTGAALLFVHTGIGQLGVLTGAPALTRGRALPGRRAVWVIAVLC